MSTRFLVILFLLTITSSVVSGRCSNSDPLARFKRNDDEVTQDYRQNEEELQRARLEYIKIQILQRLGMSKAPKIKRKQVDIAACKYIFAQEK